MTFLSYSLNPSSTPTRKLLWLWNQKPNFHQLKYFKNKKVKNLSRNLAYERPQFDFSFHTTQVGRVHLLVGISIFYFLFFIFILLILLFFSKLSNGPSNLIICKKWSFPSPYGIALLHLSMFEALSLTKSQPSHVTPTSYHISPFFSLYLPFCH